LKVVHISNSDSNGGAAVAALRICQAQQNIKELSSILLAGDKKSNNDCVIPFTGRYYSKLGRKINFILDESLIRLLTVTERGRFTFPFFGIDIACHPDVMDADLINLHWINGGFLSLRSLKKLALLNKPIVWTMHDMWAFTGGCHYSSSCDRFRDACGNCPSLLTKSNNDISKRIFEQKSALFREMKLTIVTCSNWLAEQTRESKLLRNKQIMVIPNPLNTDNYLAVDKTESRLDLNLPINKKLILIGAANLNDKRKGIDYLIESLNILSKKDKSINDRIELVSFGKIDENVGNKIPFKINQLGKLNNEIKIIKAYNSADVFVAPSLQDNLPNTVMEAMACSTPVVAFNVGGIPDMIDHLQNGFLAEAGLAGQLAEGISYILSDQQNSYRLGLNAKLKVCENFNQDLVAKKYLDLYKSILN